MAKTSTPHSQRTSRLKKEEVKFTLKKDGKVIEVLGYPHFSNGFYVHVDRRGNLITIPEAEFRSAASRQRLIKGQWVDYPAAGRTAPTPEMELKLALQEAGLEVSSEMGRIPFGPNKGNKWQGVKIPVVPAPGAEKAWQDAFTALEVLSKKQKTLVGNHAASFAFWLEQITDLLRVGLETHRLANAAGFSFDGEKWRKTV